MFDKIAAIDVGTRSIKLVMVKQNIKSFQALSFASKNIDLSIQNKEEAILDAVLRLLQEHDLKGFKIVTSLPMEKMIIRNLTFPFNDIEKIAEAIPFEAQENIPFKIEDVVMDFQSVISENTTQGQVLLAAAHKEVLREYLHVLEECEMKPLHVGLEANALYECYNFFGNNKVDNIIQVYIGHNKTILNIVTEDKLAYTRSISIGIGLIIEELADIMKISFEEATPMFEKLLLDVESLENNTNRHFYKSLKIPKSKMQQIYKFARDMIDDLSEQILISLKSFSVKFDSIEISKLLLSGGGSNLLGLADILAKQTEIPVASLPFIGENKDARFQTEFPIAFGTVLSYLNKKKISINLLKGEFLPKFSAFLLKKYYLSATFAIFALLLIAINMVLNSLLQAGLNQKYDEMLLKQFKTYFPGKKISDDPISSAKKILGDEKKQLQELQVLIPSEDTMLELIETIFSYFKGDESFKLKNIVINEKAIKLNGEISSSKILDDFKNKLNETKKFESINLNTNITKNNYVQFYLDIKMKIKK